MPHSRPKVSIGMPLYNGERYLREALNAIISQDFDDFELIIADDGSTDATEKICLEYAAKDQRIHFHRNEKNLGLMQNFDNVFKMSSGEYFMWAAQDDLREPHFISACLKELEANPNAALCYTKAQFINPQGHTIEFPLSKFDTRGLDLASRFNTTLWGISYPHQLYGLIRADSLRRTSLSQDTLGTDLVLLSELALLGEFLYVPELLFYTRRPETTSWLMQVEEFMNKIAKPVTTRRSALRWYAQMVYLHIKAVNTHVRKPTAKILLGASALLCMLVKYRWLLKAMLKVSKARRQGS